MEFTFPQLQFIVENADVPVEFRLQSPGPFRIQEGTAELVVILLASNPNGKVAKLKDVNAEATAEWITGVFVNPVDIPKNATEFEVPVRVTFGTKSGGSTGTATLFGVDGDAPVDGED
jgi:hypothetical protein